MSGDQGKVPGPHKKRKRLERRATKQVATRGKGVAIFPGRNRAVVRAILIFAGSMLLALAAYLKLVTSQLFYPILAFTAQGTALLLNSFGAQVEVSGAALSSNNFSMNMVAECTAIIPIVIFFCAVVAYPSGGKEKASGIAIGILALTVLNLIRTSSLFYIGSTFPDFLDIAHYLVWQSLMILAAIFLWLFWVEKITRVP